jgi:ElaB/YqjD/DUF883 family membrane-anchored ribosome-binding protein
MQKTHDKALVARVNGSDIQKDTRTAEQIREDIEARRRRISSMVTEIDSRVQQALDWRGHVSRHPFAAAGISATLGAATGVLLRQRRRSPLERATDTVVEAVQDARSRIDETLERTAERVGERPRRGHPSRPLIPRALASAIAKATVDFFWDKAAALKAERQAHRREEEEAAADVNVGRFGRTHQGRKDGYGQGL